MHSISHQLVSATTVLNWCIKVIVGVHGPTTTLIGKLDLWRLCGAALRKKASPYILSCSPVSLQQTASLGWKEGSEDVGYFDRTRVMPI